MKAKANTNRENLSLVFEKSIKAKDAKIKKTINIFSSLVSMHKEANKDAELEAELVKRLTEAGMIGLKGHRSVGGLRASIYNAMTLDGVKALVGLMQTFAAEKQ